MAKDRLLAFCIFQSQLPEAVGPVRSARSYYIETAKAHEALYIYHGAANFIEEDLRAGWVDNLNGAYYDDDGFLFKRNPSEEPHIIRMRYWKMLMKSQNGII